MDVRNFFYVAQSIDPVLDVRPVKSSYYTLSFLIYPHLLGSMLNLSEISYNV